MQLSAGDKMLCPHCRKEQEGLVDDYVVPGKVGGFSAAYDECGYCNGEFRVEKVANDVFVVDAK